MTRDELMLAVVEAARALNVAAAAGKSVYQERALLTHTIAALDAHRPEMEGEMVEVKAYVRLNSGRSAYIVSGMGDLNGRWREPMQGGTIATIAARVPLPRIPEIAATVAPVEAGG